MQRFFVFPKPYVGGFCAGEGYVHKNMVDQFHSVDRQIKCNYENMLTPTKQFWIFHGLVHNSIHRDQSENTTATLYHCS